MSAKSIVLIAAAFIVYVLIGGLVFYYVEKTTHMPVPQPIANDSLPSAPSLCQQLIDRVNSTLSQDSHADLNWNASLAGVILRQLGESCANLSTNQCSPSPSSGLPWQYSTALYFTITLLTTIGYGDLYPKTHPGKLFLIIYGVIGIPLAGLVLATTTDYFSSGLLSIYERVRRHRDQRRGIFIAAVVFLLPGLALFIFFPAFIFVQIEGWNYLDAVYYGFVTLSTTGFGDFTIASNMNGNWLWFYQISWIVWVILGISYWAMIIGFITKAFKSKEIRRRWAQTSSAIVHQASVMRQLLSNDQKHGFLALKSKNAFEFVLRLTDVLGQLDMEDKHRRISLPGIATAFKPNGNNRGIAAMIGVLMLGKTPQQLTSDSEDPPRENRIGRMQLQSSIDTDDSGIVLDDDGPSPQPEPPSSSPSERPTLVKMNSRISVASLPVSTPIDGQQQGTTEEHSKWKLLARSITRPELRKKNSQERLTFHKLVVEAMLIIQEAEASDMTLDLTE